MKFATQKLSKRFSAFEAAIFVMSEPPVYGSKPYRPGIDPPRPSVHSLANWYRGTAAAIILPDGRFWIGVCLCSPNDAFVKKIGREKSLGRAFQKMCSGHERDGQVTIIEAINDKPLKEPLIGSVTALKAFLEVEINAAKQRVGLR